LVGEPARRQATINPEGTIYAAKRKMGQDYKFKVHGKEYTPSRYPLLSAKDQRGCGSLFGDKVVEAVITCPAYFDDNQRQATKDAGEIAGLESFKDR